MKRLTVKELMDKLSAMPADAVVVLRDWETGANSTSCVEVVEAVLQKGYEDSQGYTSFKENKYYTKPVELVELTC